MYLLLVGNFTLLKVYVLTPCMRTSILDTMLVHHHPRTIMASSIISAALVAAGTVAAFRGTRPHAVAIGQSSILSHQPRPGESHCIAMDTYACSEVLCCTFLVCPNSLSAYPVESSHLRMRTLRGGSRERLVQGRGVRFVWLGMWRGCGVSVQTSHTGRAFSRTVTCTPALCVHGVSCHGDLITVPLRRISAFTLV